MYAIKENEMILQGTRYKVQETSWMDYMGYTSLQRKDK